jgi:H+-translocating NAD(P) transhydrogenase subunit beta
MDTRSILIQLSYFAASLLFILGLKLLGSPRTARQGMFAAEIGMLLAIVGTLVSHEVITYEWIAVGAFIGTAAGAVIAIWTPMTAMPQRTALSHAFGAMAASLVGVAEYLVHHDELSSFTMTALGFEVLLGTLTFTGSLMAFGKLQGTLPSAPLTYKGQNFFNMLLLVGMVGVLGYLVYSPANPILFYMLVAMGLAFGVLLVMPIGAADMPVVIAILNAYAGLAGSATGFALNNRILIIAGALDGASGLILSIVMCKAMNRSITNVLFGAFGKAPEIDTSAVSETQGTVRSALADEAADILRSASKIVIVPGYGMAVSQAQHSVKELMDVLSANGAEVTFAIHPVAGRMPGHMNVLLAEAGVPYERLIDMEQINPEFPRTDVAIVIGANDTVNPTARHNKSSPIYGMPILNVDQARTVFVLKRSMAPGFAGIENELFYKPNAVMVFGDATKTVKAFISSLRDNAAAA